MTDLNSLLNEAKPLYKKRTTRKKRAFKTAFVGFVFLATLPFYPFHKDTSLNALYTDLYDEEHFSSLFENIDELTDETVFLGIV